MHPDVADADITDEVLRLLSRLEGNNDDYVLHATTRHSRGDRKALAKELAPSNIQVNALACGVIDTEMNARLTPEERTALEDEIPAGRYGTPGEAAQAVLMLAEAPAYLTGQIIGLDGGI